MVVHKLYLPLHFSIFQNISSIDDSFCWLLPVQLDKIDEISHEIVEQFYIILSIEFTK